MMLGVWSSTLKIFNKALQAFHKRNQLGFRFFTECKKNKIVTFDMTVAATFEVLPDDKLIETLQEAKPELNNDDNALKATLRKLNEKQDPRRCEKVTYDAYMFIDGKREGRPLQAETVNADTWLNDLFKK